MRKVIVVIASLGLVFALGAPAEAARKFRVSVALSASSITIGQSVTISGKITPAKAGRKVVLMKRLSGAKWKREAATRVRAGGTFQFTDRPTTLKSRQYRVTIGRAGKTRPGKSRAVRVKVYRPGKITKSTPSVNVASVSTRSLEAGQSVTLTGTASSSVAGRPVLLQVGAGGSFGNVGTATIGGDGSFSVAGAITQSGAAVPIRVLVPESSLNNEAAAGAGSLQVFGWTFLYDINPVQGEWEDAAFAISGVTYGKSVGQDRYSPGNSAVAEVNLARACTRFVATVGLEDSSSTATEYIATAYADSVQRFSKSGIKLGQANPVNVDVSGSLRLKLEVQKIAGSNGDDLVWGDARILCAF